jgi:hypothetical protein
MTEHCTWESFKAEGASLVDKMKDVIRQGNVRRVIIEHDGRTIAEFPLTVGVVGAVLAPVVAAIAAIVALLKDCTIHVERVTTDADAARRSASVGQESARAN